MSRRNIEAVYPLAPMQQGMLFHSLLAPDQGAYFEQFCCTLRGTLDKVAFRRAWQEVMRRNPVLRTAFAWKSLEQMVQVVHQHVDLQMEEQDWQIYSPAEQETRLQAHLQADRGRGFDLSKAPLMRLALMALDITSIGKESYYLVWSHHHILMDGWSMPLILNEVLGFYTAYHQNRPLSIPPSRPYREYIAWLQNQDQGAAETYWRTRLKGFTSPTLLATPTVQNTGALEEHGTLGLFTGAVPQRPVDEVEIHLSTGTTTALQALARRYRITFSTIIQAAWALLLGRYSGDGVAYNDEVVFGVTVSGRPPDLPGVESMIGLFINTLPARIRLPLEQRVGEWMQNIHAQMMEMRQYEYSSLAQVQAWSEVPHGVALFESILVFENYPVDKSFRDQIGAQDPMASQQSALVMKDEAKENTRRLLAIENIRSLEQTNYPLNLISGPGEQVPLKISYDRARVDRSTIERMLTHLQTILEG
ncbi:condensation domain-containing protein, partial [Dolichospermum sp. ST_sed3]|nr:condensation domain-containing protein [Dolichospermum sp. ST_sed3]